MPDDELDLAFAPYPHQRAAHVLRQQNRNVVLVWHRRAGKTLFSVMELILAALECKKPRGRFAYVAPFLAQAKTAAWDYLKLHTKALGVTYNQQELSVEFPNGSRIRLHGADNPDSLRGAYFDGVVLDEVAHMKPETWEAVVRPAVADRQGWAIFIGTARGENLFSHLYRDALSGREGWGADLKRVYDTKVIDPAEIASTKAEMAPSLFAQEYECDFAAAVENALIASADILAAIRRTPADSEFGYAPKVIGVDVARYGDDTTVIFRRQGKACFEPIVMRGQGAQQVAARVGIEIIEWKADAVFVDETGNGSGVVDFLRANGFKVHGVESAERAPDEGYLNVRAYMWKKVAEWLRHGGCLPNNPNLVAELMAPTYWYRPDGRLQLEAKEDIKKRLARSPDLADALALTFAMPVAPKPVSVVRSEVAPGKFADIPVPQMPTRHKAGIEDYNPYERDAS